MQEGKDPSHSGHLGPEFNHVGQELRRTLNLRIARSAGQSLTGLRGMVLGYIARCNAAGQAVYQRDVEEQFHTGRSSVATLLKGMESSGLITRESVSSDARLKSLALTEQGKICHKAIHREIDAFEAELSAALGTEQTAALQAALQTILETLHGMQADCAAQPDDRRKGKNL